MPFKINYLAIGSMETLFIWLKLKGGKSSGQSSGQSRISVVHQFGRHILLTTCRDVILANIYHVRYPPDGWLELCLRQRRLSKILMFTVNIIASPCICVSLKNICIRIHLAIRINIYLFYLTCTDIRNTILYIGF